VSRAPKPAVVRFYLDADVVGLAKVLAELRPDVTYPGDPGKIIHRHARPRCIITHPETADPDWIPAVAAQGTEATGTWAQLEIVMTRWRRLERLTAQPGPFVYALTGTGPPRPIALT